MSIKGRDYTWFRASIDRGELAGAWAAAHAMPHQLILTDALDLLTLMASQMPDSYERGAAKWLGRLLTERPGLTLEQIGIALAALDRLDTVGDEPHQLLTRYAKG